MRILRAMMIALAAIALPLGLAACKKTDSSGESGATTSTQALAKVAPPAGKTWAEVISVTPEGGFRMGNPDAPIKLVEYGSLTCPHCAEFAELSGAKIRDDYVASGRVSFEFRNFVRDPLDITAAVLVRCAAPESFFALTEATFANQVKMVQAAQAKGETFFQQVQNAPEDQRYRMIAEGTGLLDFFAANGLPREQALQCLGNTATAQKLAQNTEEQAKALSIEGTPTFLLNGTKIDANTWPLVDAALQAAGAR